MNLVSLEFRTVTLITLAAMLALSLFVAAMMPPRSRRTAQTDAIEFALVTLLTVIFSPLSFNYAYVWLMYPTALALHRVLGDASDPRPRSRLGLAWIAAVLLIPAMAVVAPQGAQAAATCSSPRSCWSSAWGGCSDRKGIGPPTPARTPRTPTPRIAGRATSPRRRGPSKGRRARPAGRSPWMTAIGAACLLQKILPHGTRVRSEAQ